HHLRQQRTTGTRRRSYRPRAEVLEDRTVPSHYVTAATITDLINDINYANAHPGSHTIVLAPHKNFAVTAVNNTRAGATRLPVLAASDNLTIIGNGDTIARSTATGPPAFRLFDVARGAALTLEDMTLANGLATDPTEAGPSGPVVLGGGI